MSADQGNEREMNNYGTMLENGEGVPENQSEALRYYSMAADKGNEEAIKNYVRIQYGLSVRIFSIH